MPFINLFRNDKLPARFLRIIRIAVMYRGRRVLINLLIRLCKDLLLSLGLLLQRFIRLERLAEASLADDATIFDRYDKVGDRFAKRNVVRLYRDCIEQNERSMDRDVRPG